MILTDLIASLRSRADYCCPARHTLVEQDRDNDQATVRVGGTIIARLDYGRGTINFPQSPDDLTPTAAASIEAMRTHLTRTSKSGPTLPLLI